MKYFQRNLLQRGAQKRQIVASFYYSYREGEQQTNHSNMLRSVLYDILNQNEEFFFHFQPYYREASQGDGHPEWCYESLKGVLLSLAKNHPLCERLYLILDAIDESDDCGRTDVIKFLRELCAAKGPCIVKVFVASRPIIGLNGHLTWNQRVIRLQDVNYSDISTFTASFLGSPELDLPLSIANSATEYITENAQGVFVWVHLVREELLEYARDGYTKNQIFDFLKSLPTELEGIYKGILMRLEGGKGRNIEDGQKMLQFVLFTYRPLGLDELGQALAIRDNFDSEFSCSDESFEGDLICGIEKRILSCTGNLLEIKARGDHGISLSLSRYILLTNGLAEKSVVQVMHHTVREFFRSDGPTAQSTFRMNSNDANMRISNTCVRYLILCASKTASIDQAAGSKPWTSEQFEDYARYLSGRPFLNYALGFVKRHLQQFGQVTGVSELASQLFKTLNEIPAAYVLENWIPEAWGQRIVGCEQQDYSKEFRAKLLHTATHMGYPQVAEALLIGGAEVEACLEGNTPLMVAAKRGDLATARVLLDQKALVGARDGNNRMALHLAAANGHSPVVELLLDRGADKEARKYKEQTALHLAASNGHSPVVELLCNRGADMGAKDGKEQTALHLAVANGHGPVVELLLNRSADMEAKDGKSQTTLHLAAENGHGPVAELLLNRGADMEAKDGKSQTALHLAAANGHGPIVELLLNRGADIEAKDISKRTALHLAAAEGRNPVVRLLIDRGTDKEAQDGEKQTAVHLAAANGHDPAIVLLVDRGANRNAKDRLGWGALHTAAWNGHITTMEMLVQNLQANKEERDKCGWTAIHVAAINGRDTAIRWLVERLGVDKAAKDKLGWTALHFVAALGLEDTAQLLIKTLKVDRDTPNNEGSTAQHLAQKR